ncbi:hypothetical protein KVR01_007498 [Diaporthe batatas]|uniref:uncharacterized protein n=1 Tax=Diaporthe batatas TaxID=748121 RepID=UPI001D045328|nr:uncharacterized protein KVR01_007498 [Diaporthe batatas]KAG8163020.1 hypothetical protein KVR01_007498 [Diaporthe batatas]
MGKEPTLIELAAKHGTDKHGNNKPDPDGTIRPPHKYAGHYDFHFSRYRHLDNINVLEIGVGGYEDPKKGGDSLRMWKEYFPKAQIIGVDYYDKTALQEDRIRIYQGSQDDPAFLERISEENGGFDVIIDDGSHCSNHVIASFKILFPLLKMGGIYAIEDLQTSYWKPIFGGSSTDLSTQTTSMGFLKSLVDGLNHMELDILNYKPTYFDKHITSIQFYHNLAFIYKGENDEESNWIGPDHTIPKGWEAISKPKWAD